MGYDEAGQLTEKIRRKPYSVVLFDEIEKAHPDVLNVLLQILDDGQITDAHGRKVNFENTDHRHDQQTPVPTPSPPVRWASAAAPTTRGRSASMKALRDFLRPEFLNRVDEIVCFNHLSKENFRRYRPHHAGGAAQASLSDKGYTFRYDDALVDYLVEKSYSMTYGARNLRRLIQKELEDPMAARIIDSIRASHHPDQRYRCATARCSCTRCEVSTMLFRKNIDPRCAYCAKGSRINDEQGGLRQARRGARRPTTAAHSATIP